MNEKIQLAAMNRTSEPANKKYILAEVYGLGVENQHIMVEAIAFQKAFQRSGVSTLIDLEIDGKPAIKVIVREVQKDPLKDNPIHVDFYQIDMNKRLTTKVNLVTKNTSPAVQMLGGILIKNLEKLEVECLPDSLIHEIEIDLSTLVHLKDVVRVSEITVPANVIIKNNPRDIVISVVAPRQQKEETTPEVAVGAEAPTGAEATDKPAEGEVKAKEGEVKAEQKKKQS